MIAQIYKLVDAYGAAGYLSFDLGLYRSLDYYTGMLLKCICRKWVIRWQAADATIR